MDDIGYKTLSCPVNASTYTITVYPESNSDYVSEFYAGLADLHATGVVDLRFGTRPAHRVRPINEQGILWLEVESAGARRPRRVCFDVFDWHEIASMDDLAAADIYFKRSYHAPYIGQLDARLRNKVVPLGLHYACSSRNETVLMRFRRMFALSANCLPDNQGSMRPIARLFASPAALFLRKLGYADSEKSPMFMDAFEVHPHEPAERKIFYRTRVYSPQDAKDTYRLGRLEEINDMRVDTIRALKGHFGDRFIGGLRPSPFAKQHYPDCMFPEDRGLRGHLELSKACLINVSTAGLHDSTSWKIPEYMAASRCIVSEPLTYETPVPLIEGIHHLAFRTPNECVRACEELLGDTEMASHMREANFAYYVSNVRPAQLMLTSLQATFEHRADTEDGVLEAAR